VLEPEVLPIEEVLPACEPTEDWLPAEASGVELLDGVVLLLADGLVLDCEALLSGVLLADGVELVLDCEEALLSGVVLELAPGVELVDD
jgi:hypothetical protein